MDATNGPGIPPQPPQPPHTPQMPTGPGPGPGPGADSPMRRTYLPQAGAKVPRGARATELRVSRGVLWIGAAAIPLRHIASVEVSRAKSDALLRVFLVVLVFAGALYYASSSSTSREEEGTAALLLVLVVVVGFALTAFRPARPVLVVETAGGSTAAVTLPDIEQLRSIAGLIVGAIDGVPGEFTAVVQRVRSQAGADSHAPVVRGRDGRGLRYR